MKSEKIVIFPQFLKSTVMKKPFIYITLHHGTILINYKWIKCQIYHTLFFFFFWSEIGVFLLQYFSGKLLLNSEGTMVLSNQTMTGSFQVCRNTMASAAIFRTFFLLQLPNAQSQDCCQGVSRGSISAFADNGSKYVLGD